MVLIWVKDIWNRIVDYHRLQNEYDNLVKADMVMIEQIQELQKSYDELVKLSPKSPHMDDAEYWNNKWQQNKVRYRAPNTKAVTEYVKYREIKEITDIANMLIRTDALVGNDFDSIPLSALKWLEEQFKVKKFKYQLDKGEDWSDPETLLERKYGDCDDWGILLYSIIREIFKQLGNWDKVKHRLKCVAGNVNNRGSIPSGAGGHFYLNWLHFDGNWYTVESTYYRPNAIANFGKLPQKLNPMYGTIWFTFNEQFSWAQNSLTVTKEDLTNET